MLAPQPSWLQRLPAHDLLPHILHRILGQPFRDLSGGEQRKEKSPGGHLCGQPGPGRPRLRPHAAALGRLRQPEQQLELWAGQ